MELEEKTFPFEIKSLTEEGTFEGYAAIFGTKDQLDPPEIVEPGAFKKSLSEIKVYPITWYHDVRNILGISYPEEDAKGLKVKGDLNMEIQSAKEKYALMKQKAIRGLSIGFKTMREKWENGIRRILEIKLYEIALVTFPAHPKALISSVKEYQPFDEEKPYPNEHSARIKSPDLFDKETFRRTPDGTIYGSKKVPATAAVIWGKLKGAAKPSDNPIPQAIRFPTKNWSAVQAKKWLKDSNIKYEKFEAAAKSFEGVIEFLEEEKSGRVISAVNMKRINNALKELIELLEAAAPLKSTHSGGKGIIPESIGRLGQDKTPQPHLYLEGIEIPKS